MWKEEWEEGWEGEERRDGKEKKGGKTERRRRKIKEGRSEVEVLGLPTTTTARGPTTQTLEGDNEAELPLFFTCFPCVAGDGEVSGGDTNLPLCSVFIPQRSRVAEIFDVH